LSGTWRANQLKTKEVPHENPLCLSGTVHSCGAKLRQKTKSGVAMTTFIPSATSSPASEPMQYYGLLGDYVGGFWGTIIGAITLVVVFVTWRSSRRIDYKSKTYQIFAEMLRTHEEIVSSIRIGNLVGRDALEVMLSEFYFIYRATRKLVPSYEDWAVEQRIDIAYTMMYYGLQLQTQRVLSNYDTAKIQSVANLVTRARQTNESLEQPKDKRRFPGHQNRLSHYFRNLYNAYRFINRSELSLDEKEDLGRILRTKLSNYEQALLTLNVISHLGRPWEEKGLIRRYMPIKNVPRDFFSFDDRFILKNRFCCVKFEWE
jgi:hypothetical protein